MMKKHLLQAKFINLLKYLYKYILLLTRFGQFSESNYSFHFGCYRIKVIFFD